MFEGRTLVIATKHSKEKVIAPLLTEKLGVVCRLPIDFDSDTFGTFSGEIERADDPLTTARNKCLSAMDLTGCDLAIASEGSFGAHPSLFFVPADDEFLLLIDKKNNLEIVAREISTDTNFAGKSINSLHELKEFADKVQFPSHGLILRNAKDSNKKIVKGITSWDNLSQSYRQLIDEFGSVYAETDMRAMYNPMRMKVIETATNKLINKVLSKCPQCNTPGFDIKEFKKGLPCELCGAPTRSVISHIFACNKCGYTSEKNYPYGKEVESAMYCDYCNP